MTTEKVTSLQIMKACSCLEDLAAVSLKSGAMQADGTFSCLRSHQIRKN
uniref:Uncharacterized protein n=1 Tax=Romanomermis culicivorax TaxID=13658 RepID=A0A915K7Q7_ROMCU